MSNSIVYVQNSTGPNMTITLSDKASGALIDLTGATLTMPWRALNTTALLPTTGMMLTPSSTPTNGVFTLVWGSNALFQPVGFYEGQVIIVQGGITSIVVTPLRVQLVAHF